MDPTLISVSVTPLPVWSVTVQKSWAETIPAANVNTNGIDWMNFILYYFFNFLFIFQIYIIIYLFLIDLTIQPVKINV